MFTRSWPRCALVRRVLVGLQGADQIHSSIAAFEWVITPRRAKKAGHPIGVITAYVPVNGKIWMTATRDRVRVKAIARDGRSSVVMSSKGTAMDGGKTVTYKGHTVVHDDKETKLWMYDLLAQGMAASKDDGHAFTKGLDPGSICNFTTLLIATLTVVLPSLAVFCVRDVREMTGSD